MTMRKRSAVHAAVVVIDRRIVPGQRRARSGLLAKPTRNVNHVNRDNDRFSTFNKDRDVSGVFGQELHSGRNMESSQITVCPEPNGIDEAKAYAKKRLMAPPGTKTSCRRPICVFLTGDGSGLGASEWSR